MSHLNSRPSRKQLQEARNRRIAKADESKCERKKENLIYELFLEEIKRGKVVMERNEADDAMRNLESTGKDRYYCGKLWFDNITSWLEYCFDHRITFSTWKDELDHLTAIVINGNNDNDESSDEFAEFIEYAKMHIGMREIIKDIQKDISYIDNHMARLDEMILSNERIIQKLKYISKF